MFIPSEGASPMQELDIYQAIQSKLPDAVVEIHEPVEPTPPKPKKGQEDAKIERPKPLGAGPKTIGWIEVKPESILDVLTLCRDDADLKLDFPHCVSGVDYAEGEPLGVTYTLGSIANKHWASIKVTLPRDNPVIESCVAIFPGMDWHEREAFDLVGIRFANHPNLRRILCAEDWEGHPLRKDYAFPESYHGIPTGKEIRWNS